MFSQKVRKIAVNITSPCDLNKVHVEVLNFLPKFSEPFQVDYYVSHNEIKITDQEKKFVNSTIYYSPPYCEEIFLNHIKHEWNKLIISATEKLCQRLFRSQVNSTRMHKNSKTDIYDFVINYSKNMNKFKINHHLISSHNNSVNSNFIEDNFMYTEIFTPMDPYIDSSFFVSTQSTFNRIILFWQFVRLLDDWIFTNDWWKVWQTDPEYKLDPEGLILPCWLDMQGIFLRSAYEL